MNGGPLGGYWRANARIARQPLMPDAGRGAYLESLGIASPQRPTIGGSVAEVLPQLLGMGVPMAGMGGLFGLMARNTPRLGALAWMYPSMRGALGDSPAAQMLVKSIREASERATAAARRSGADFDRILLDERGRPYAYIPVRQGRGSPPRLLPR